MPPRGRDRGYRGPTKKVTPKQQYRGYQTPAMTEYTPPKKFNTPPMSNYTQQYPPYTSPLRNEMLSNMVQTSVERQLEREQDNRQATAPTYPFQTPPMTNYGPVLNPWQRFLATLNRWRNTGLSSYPAGYYNRVNMNEIYQPGVQPMNAALGTPAGIGSPYMFGNQMVNNYGGKFERKFKNIYKGSGRSSNLSARHGWKQQVESRLRQQVRGNEANQELPYKTTPKTGGTEKAEYPYYPYDNSPWYPPGGGGGGGGEYGYVPTIYPFKQYQPGYAAQGLPATRSPAIRVATAKEGYGSPYANQNISPRWYQLLTNWRI